MVKRTPMNAPRPTLAQKTDTAPVAASAPPPEAVKPDPRAGMRGVTFMLASEIYVAVKAHCAERRITTQAYLTKLIEDDLIREGRIHPASKSASS